MVGLRAGRVVELADLRVAGGVMLAAAFAGPVFGAPGLPCPLRALTGIPCPLCGMTTSVTEAVHLDVASALAANPAGLVAVAVAVALLMFRRVERVRVPAVAGPAGLVAMWAFQLQRFQIL